MLLYEKYRTENRALPVHCCMELANHPYISVMLGCGMVTVTIVIQFGNVQILIENALHFLSVLIKYTKKILDIMKYRIIKET